MAYTYSENNVFEEALNRIRFIYDECDDVCVAMSGGKDSTVVFHLALMIAQEKGRLPLKVFWLDQEAEWQSTVDYMDGIMRRPDVKPYWFQVPFAFPNNLSNQHNSLMVWDSDKEEEWIHPKAYGVAITEPFVDMSKVDQDKAFYKGFRACHKYIGKGSQHCAILVGTRIQESPARRLAIVGSKARYKGITWCTKEKGNIKQFYPIYDFTSSDIWAAIAKNKWEYNRLYDLQYQYGVKSEKMRCSALIHETAWGAIELLQELEPKTYNRFVRRVAGTSTMNHAFDTEVIPKHLPFMFASWKEYRDYLLMKIVKPEYWEVFRNRWKGQDGDTWYKIHVKECIINDTYGTINRNEIIRQAQVGYKRKKLTKC